MIAQANHTNGERLKLRAHALLAARRDLYILRGRRALLLELLECGVATADSVRHSVRLPEALNPKLFGAVPGELARAGIIARAGFAQTTRPKAHARPVSVWKLLNQAAAVDWLAEHPDRPDATQSSGADCEPTLFDLARNAKPDAATSGGTAESV